MSITETATGAIIEPQAGAPWHVLGAGSIGCLFAAKLQRAGIATRVVLRDPMRLEQWRAAGGIALREASGQHTIAVPAIAAHELSMATGSIRKLLVCTKAQQTLAAIDSIRAALAEDALIVLLQNGMGVREQLQARLPGVAVVHALSTEGAYQMERFHVVHAGTGETLIGAADPANRPLARAAAAQLQCGLRVEAVDDIEARLWSKLAVNSVINPLTALHDCRNGEVPELPGIDELLPALCREAALAAEAAGQPFSVDSLIAQVRHVCRVTAANRSSMLQDIAAGRLTEIDFINGHIVRVAQSHGIDCPRQHALLSDIKALERRRGCR